MLPLQESAMTRRRFVASTTWAAGVACFAPRHLSAAPGSSVEAARASAARSSITVVIPGHGPVGGKPDLTMFRDVLVEVRDKVMALKKQGRSLSETIAARPGARYDAQWSQGFVSSSAFVGLVYQGV